MNDIVEVCEDEQTLCDAVQEEYGDLLSELEYFGEKKLAPLDSLQTLRNIIFPENPHIILVGDEFHFQSGTLNLVILNHFFITPILVLQILGMLSYWYLIACAIDSTICYFKRKISMTS